MTPLPTVERLKLQAARASDISRQMAEAKSLRQESNTEQRTDLYMWPTPEQTTEGKAAELIATLYEDAEFLCARIRELEGEMTDDGELSRQYFGHVIPALARMESALAETRGETA